MPARAGGASAQRGFPGTGRAVDAKVRQAAAVTSARGDAGRGRPGYPLAREASRPETRSHFEFLLFILSESGNWRVNAGHTQRRCEAKLLRILEKARWCGENGEGYRVL